MKKGRSIFLAIAAIVIMATTQVFAQGTKMPKYGNDSVQCITHISLYREFYKQQNYIDALPHWRWVFKNCPIASLNTYIDGAKMMGYMADNAKEVAKHEKYIDTLMMVYDQRIKYYNREGYVEGRKFLELLNYRPTDTLTIYHGLRHSIELEGVNSDPVVVSNYFLLNDYIVRSGRFAADSIAAAYDFLSEITDENLAGDKDLERWGNTKQLLEAIFEPYATCDQLIKIYSKKFNESPNDTVLLKKITFMLDKKDCTDSDLFFMATENLHKAKPTGSSAYLMGRMYLKKGDSDKASDYFLEAIPLIDDQQKTMAYFYLAYTAFEGKNYSAARSYCLKSLAINPNDGKVYLLIGDMYAITAPNCGDDEIAKRAGYWTAVDKYYKAKQVDPTVAEEANAKIATYSRQFPLKERLFFNDIKQGSTYTVNCWYSETTTVRSSD
jgi:tetratricopeptide (TPR) repeat protein